MNYNQSVLTPSQLEVLQFDDEQEMKVGAALQALVDQITKEEVIELLSDSDGEEGFQTKVGTNRNGKSLVTRNNGSMVELSADVEPSALTANVAYKFNYDNMETCMNAAGASTASIECTSTYTTSADFSGQRTQVEVNDEPKFDDVQISADKIEVEPDIQHLDMDAEKEAIEEIMPDIQATQKCMQLYQGDEEFQKSDASGSIEHVWHVGSSEYSNGCRAVFGTDDVDIGSFSDDNISTQEAKEILIDLVDSSTEDETETGDLGIADDATINLSNCDVSSTDNFLEPSCPQCGIKCGNFTEWKLHTDSEHKFNTIEALNMQTIIDKAGHICYQCRDCSQKFKLNLPFHKLLPHRLSHLPNESYIGCRLCEAQFRNRTYGRRHLIHVHFNECRKYLQKRIRPNASAMKYIRITCPICREELSSRKHWQEHLESKHDYSQYIMSQVSLTAHDVYVCTICEVKIRKRSIMDHILTHELYKSFACTYCSGYAAGHWMVALAHVRRVHLKCAKDKNFKCSYCGAIFQRAVDRKNHISDNHQVKLQKCAVCDKQFSSISLLLSHMNFANHHKLK